MQQPRILFFLMIAVFCCGMIGVATPALALDPLGYVIDLADISQSECMRVPELAGTLSARAVACMRVMTYTAAATVVAPIARFMLPIGGAVIFLSIVLFGVRMTMGGVRSPKGEGLLLLIKAAFVMVMLTSLSTGASSLNIGRIAVAVQDELMDWGATLFGNMAQEGTAQLFIRCNNSLDPTLPGPAGGLNRSSIELHIPITTTSPNGQTSVTMQDVKQEVRLWNALDCILGMLFGMVAGVAFWTGIVSLIMATAMSGPLGIAILFGTIMLMFTIILYVMRCIFYIMHAYLAIAVILIFVPLVIPTLMFRRTMSYFTKWLFIYIGIIFQPFILVIFMSVSIFGASYFIAGSTGSPPSNWTRNAGVVYSIYEVLGFDRIRNADLKVQSEMRRIVLRNMVRDEGVVLFDILSSRELSNIADIVGKQITRDVAGGLATAKKYLDAFTASSDVGTMIRSLQSLSSVSLDPIWMPIIDLRINGTYDRFLRKVQGEIPATPANDGLTPQILQAFRATGMVGGAFDPQTHKWVASGGPNPHYITLIPGRVDANFQEWFLMKLSGSVFSAFLMIFLFVSLNQAVPQIARSIVGSGGIAITGGMASLLSRGGRSAPVSGDSGVPFADRIESFLGSTEARWTRAEKRGGSTFNPVDNVSNFVRRGGGALVASGREAIVENTDLGAILSRIQSAAKPEVKK